MLSVRGLQIAAIRRRERPSLSVGASQHLTQEAEEGGAVSGVAEARPANGNGISPTAADEPCPEGFGTSVAASASEDVRSSEEARFPLNPCVNIVQARTIAGSRMFEPVLALYPIPNGTFRPV